MSRAVTVQIKTGGYVTMERSDDGELRFWDGSTLIMALPYTDVDRALMALQQTSDRVVWTAEKHQL